MKRRRTTVTTLLSFATEAKILTPEPESSLVLMLALWVLIEETPQQERPEEARIRGNPLPDIIRNITPMATHRAGIHPEGVIGFPRRNIISCWRKADVL